MAAQSRIISRKIFIIATYEQLVQSRTMGQEGEVDIILYHDKSQALMHMRYMAERFFTNGEKSSDEIYDMIDISFLTPMIIGWSTHVITIKDIISEYATTFAFDRMDPIDQAIFLCGGIEYIVHKTPPKIILNEMIEIAKRYGDEGAPKLVNGIGHSMIEKLSKMQ